MSLKKTFLQKKQTTSNFLFSALVGVTYRLQKKCLQQKIIFNLRLIYEFNATKITKIGKMIICHVGGPTNLRDKVSSKVQQENVTESIILSIN